MRGLIAQEVDGESEAVEDGGAVVSERKVVDGEWRGAVIKVMLACAAGSEVADSGSRCVDVRGEVLKQRGLAVEGDYSNFVRDVADDGFEHWSQWRSDGAVFVELASTGAADFDDDDEGERSAASILLERELLRNAIVREREVVGGEGEDEFSGFIADQRGNKNQGGVGAESGLRRDGGLSVHGLNQCRTDKRGYGTDLHGPGTPAKCIW